MAMYNRIIIAGNLCREVEVKELAGDKTVADITVAVNEGYGEKQTVSYVDVTLWNNDAKFAANYLTKGANVLVEGRIKQERWEQEGKTRSKIKVIANKLVGLGKSSAPVDVPPATPAAPNMDQVPF